MFPDSSCYMESPETRRGTRFGIERSKLCSMARLLDSDFSHENITRLVAPNLPIGEAKAVIEEAEVSKVQNGLPDQQRTVRAVSHTSYIQAIIPRSFSRAKS